MAENVCNLETRLTVLEARLAQHETEISRLRKLLAQSRRRGWLLALAGVAGLLIASATWLVPAAAQGGTVGVASTGDYLRIGPGNSPSLPGDTTSLTNPNFPLNTLMTRTLRIANFTDSDVSTTTVSGFRTAIVGFTSGTDTSGPVTRVGVMGMVDRDGYGVYGASPSGIGGAFAGGAAQLRLVPGATAGPPSGTSHLTGELYLDSLGDLYLCTLGGATPRWTKLNSSSSYLPMVRGP